MICITKIDSVNTYNFDFILNVHCAYTLRTYMYTLYNYVQKIQFNTITILYTFS